MGGVACFETFNKKTPYPIEHTAIECQLKGDKCYLGVVNQQDVYPVYPVKDIIITMSKKYKDVQLKTESEEVLEVTYEGEKTLIRLSKLELFHLIELSNEGRREEV